MVERLRSQNFQPIVFPTSHVSEAELKFPIKSVSRTSQDELLKIPDYEFCLEVYQVGTTLLSEYCIPVDKPRNCPDLSWKQINRVFIGIGCKRHTANVKVGLKYKCLCNNIVSNCILF